MRDKQIAALEARARLYDESALTTHDRDMTGAFRQAAKEMREAAERLRTDTEYELPRGMLRELGLL